MSNSNLPNGGYALTNGSNYMMDGFHFDTEYGNGVLEKARLPEAKGLSSLPSGMIPNDSPLNSDLPTGVEIDTQMDLGDLTKESSAQDISIVDHDWLASEAVEDLEGMRSYDDVIQQFADGKFDHPQVNQLKTLQDAWGDGRTTGLDIIPNTNREKVKVQKEKKVSILPQDLVDSSMRKLAYGERVEDILKEHTDLPQTEFNKLASLLRSEYGLHGRVYLKEKYFNGIFNGKWDEVINKRCATSLYIIPKNKDCIHDRFLGREVSSSINWDKVANTLLPRLETYGVKIASGDSKERVRNAFVDLLEGRVASVNGRDTYFFIQENQSDLISLDYARKQLKEAQEDTIFIASQEMVHESKLEKRLSRIASQLIANQFLDKEQVEAVLESDKTAQDKINRLYELSSKPTDVSEYKGHQLKAHILEKKSEFKDIKGKKIALDKLKSKVASLVNNGFITVDEAVKVASKYKDNSDKIRAIYEYVGSKQVKTSTVENNPVNSFSSDFDLNTRSETTHTASQQKRSNVSDLVALQNNYNSKLDSSSVANQQKETLNQIKRMISANLISQKDIDKIITENKTVKARLDAINNHIAQVNNVEKPKQTAHYMTNKKASHFESELKISTWLRQKMSEGVCGGELDILLNSRFASEILDSNKDLISSLREAHEGLSGHVYVDTDAYIKEGCDKGALIHRANQIPTIMKNSNCGQCVFNSQGTCQKYNKPLIKSASEILENVTDYQQENIRLANCSDADRTASLFVNDYDPSEFGLSQENNISLDEMPSNSQLEGVLFGGFEV